MLNGIQHYPRTFLDMLEISCLLILAKSRQDSSNVNWNPALYLDKLEVSYLLFLAQSRQDSSNVIWNPAFSCKIFVFLGKSMKNPAYFPAYPGKIQG